MNADSRRLNNMTENKKKFAISADETLYYCEKEVEAETEEEAKEKYIEMIDRGEVEVAHSNYNNINIK